MNRKLNMTCLWACAISAFALASPLAQASPTLVKLEIPEGRALRQGAALLIRVPYENVLIGELPTFYIGISNVANDPLPLLEHIIGDSDYQLLCEARAEPLGGNLTRPQFIPSWPKLVETGSFKELKRGESRIFRADQIDPKYQFLPEGAREIRWSLLTGPDEWMLSDWVRIKMISQKLADAELLGIIEDRSSAKYPLRKATIDGESYLFLVMTRIARIPVGATPRFEWDRAKWLLTVHFDGVSVPPLVLYTPQREPVSWTPETAPHMVVLEGLKKELQSMSRKAIDPTTEGKNALLKGALKEGHSAAESAARKSNHSPIWIISLVGALLLVWLLVRFWRVK